MNNQAIGLFDSGFGGLTVLKEVRRILPHENIVYLGDTARLPYGNKSPETVLKYAQENAAFLLEKNIKLLIVACHTACSHALETLQKTLPIPVIGVVQPGFKLLMESTRIFRIAILGTASTISSGIYQNLVRTHFPAAQVYPIPCPLFVPLIEEGCAEHKAAEWLAKDYLGHLKQENIDAALLACTHYPLMSRVLQKVLGPKVQLIEPATACALEAKQTLQEKQLLNPTQREPTIEFFATDDPEKFQRLGKSFFGNEISQVRLKKNYEIGVEIK